MFFMTTKKNIYKRILRTKIIYKMIYQKRCNPDKKFVTNTKKKKKLFINSMISYLKKLKYILQTSN